MNTSIKFTLINNNIVLYFLSDTINESSNEINNYFMLDNDQLIKFLNFNTLWYYDLTISFYPFYKNKLYDICDITEFLFGKLIKLDFIDNNKYNLRKTNINISDIKHKFNENIEAKYNVEEYIQGHYRNKTIYNPFLKIRDGDSFYYIMYTEKDTLIKL